MTEGGAILRFALRRSLGFIPVLLGVLVITFLAARALPGDPVGVMLSDHSGDLALAARLRHEYGLDRPMAVQFVTYVEGLLHGDFGLSFRYVGQPVTQVLRESLLISPVLALSAIFLALPLGVLGGVHAAIHRNSMIDTGIMALLVLGLSVPNFAIATLLIYVLSVRLEILPVAGWGTLQQAVLPVVTLAIPSAAYIARLVRTFMLEVLNQDYVRTARAKGLPESIVIYRHALRNTLVPLMTSVGVIFGGLISNTVVVETIFNIPGLGRLAIDSVFARDYPVVMAVVVLFTVFYAAINLVVDILYAVVDPRIRAREATT